MAKEIKDSLRSSDFIVRWGGDEFCAYLFDADLEIATKIAERIKNRIEEVFVETKNGDIVRRTISIGLAVLDDPGITAEEFIKNADEALLEAKKGDKNSIKIFSSKDQDVN